MYVAKTMYDFLDLLDVEVKSKIIFNGQGFLNC